MKIKFLIGILLVASSLTGCKKYLDQGSDPSTPQNPDLASVLPAMISNIPRGVLFDSRTMGHIIQNWSNISSGDNYELHGTNSGTDFGGDIWRMAYYGLGKNLDYMIKKAEAEQEWAYAGVALALKAWSFQTATDYHGEIIYKEAFDENKYFFNFDSQETVYKGVDSLCKRAIAYLNRTDGKVPLNLLARGDLAYSGNRDRWKRFTFGILARNKHHLTNKGIYNPDLVMAYVDSAFVSGADNFYCPHNATRNDDANFLGTYRDNMGGRRQSRFIVQLLDGTIMPATGTGTPSTWANRDPRLGAMLTSSLDSTTSVTVTAVNGGYRYFTAQTGDIATSLTIPGTLAARRVSTLWGNNTPINPNYIYTAATFDPSQGRFLFRDRAPLPVMTYHELQFIKAEAAFIKGDPTTALAAYRTAIDAHFDFVNDVYFRGGLAPALTAAQKAQYMNSAAVKNNPNLLTLTDIMLQKYIGDWGWNFVESWVDMRRYHYFDLDPATGQQVYRTYTIPSYAAANLGQKPCYRLLPRFNSEYVWNIEALRAIGGLNQDYHTYECWFSQP